MTPIELIRKFIPVKTRVKGYTLAIAIAGRSKWLLYPFLFLLHGHIPKGIAIVKGKPAYTYEGIKINSPRDGIEAYVEVFMNNVYDCYYTPHKGDVVIDIGAYVGMFSIKASNYVGSGGLVIAVEPLPSNIEYLRKNTEGLHNVTVIGKALSNYDGIGKLYVSPYSAAHSMAYVRSNYVKVQVAKLDTLVKSLKLTRVDYIKMDAEGSDLKVLQGARIVLKRFSPILSMACYHIDEQGNPHINKVIKYLNKYNYEYIVERGYIYAQRRQGKHNV